MECHCTQIKMEKGIFKTTSSLYWAAQAWRWKPKGDLNGPLWRQVVEAMRMLSLPACPQPRAVLVSYVDVDGRLKSGLFIGKQSQVCDQEMVLFKKLEKRSEPTRIKLLRDICKGVIQQPTPCKLSSLHQALGHRWSWGRSVLSVGPGGQYAEVTGAKDITLKCTKHLFISKKDGQPSPQKLLAFSVLENESSFLSSAPLKSQRTFQASGSVRFP